MGYSESAGQVLRHVQNRAPAYFPQLKNGDLKVQLLEEQHRTVSSVYRIEVRCRHQNFRIFAKGAPRGKPAMQESPATRARLAPPLPTFDERALLEYRALRSIDDYFGSLGDSRFGAIRVLDIMRHPKTIIMLENTDPSLRSLFAGTNRWRHLRGKGSNLETAFSHAGAWLKAYSRMPRAETELLIRHTHRDDFVASIGGFTRFLSSATGDELFLESLSRTVCALARDTLPEELPLGLGHGDYAMRNILVGPGSRITAFDTGARWRVPVYEDVAYFLVTLESNRLQVFSQGLAVHPRSIQSYRKAFLTGYFGVEEIPFDTLWLFEMQALLDSWCSQVTRYSQSAAGIAHSYKRGYLLLLNRHFKRLATARLHGNV
jgi:hypothetical protein